MKCLTIIILVYALLGGTVLFTMEEDLALKKVSISSPLATKINKKYPLTLLDTTKETSSISQEKLNSVLGKEASLDSVKCFDTLYTITTSFKEIIKKVISSDEKSIQRNKYQTQVNDVLKTVNQTMLETYYKQWALFKISPTTRRFAANYWYDRYYNPGNKGVKVNNDDSLVELETVMIDNDFQVNNQEKSFFKNYIKKDLFSVAQLQKEDPNPIIIQGDAIDISNKNLRSLSGIETLITRAVNDIEKIYFQGNKFKKTDLKLLTSLYPYLQRVSYQDNPLEKVDLHNSKGLTTLDIRSLVPIKYMNSECLRTLPQMTIYFYNHSFSDVQKSAIATDCADKIRLLKRIRNTAGRGLCFGLGCMLFTLIPLSIAESQPPRPVSEYVAIEGSVGTILSLVGMGMEAMVPNREVTNPFDCCCWPKFLSSDPYRPHNIYYSDYKTPEEQ